MSDRAKLVTLAVLVAVLVVLVYLFYIRQRPMTVRAPSGSAVAEEGKMKVKIELPDKGELSELNAWFNAPPVEEASHGVKGQFGVRPAEEPSDGRTPLVRLTAPDGAPLAPVPALGGIMTVGGELKAIVGGRTYARGEVVPGSGYHIVDITPATVTFEDGQGRKAKARILQ